MSLCIKRRIIALLLYALVLIALVINRTFYQASQSKIAQRRWRHESSPSHLQSTNTTMPPQFKTILLWTNYYSVQWSMSGFEYNALCPNRCRIINDRNEFDSAAAILFHSAAWDLTLYDLPTSRQPDQYFVYYNQEPPPKSSWKDLEGVWQSFPPHFFNLTMTYRTDSDIVTPYDRFVSKAERINGVPYEEHVWDDVVAAVRRKTKLGLQFVGNCYSESGRESIVRALQRYISIDQFGYCAADYRFFIAFENNICRDYVTEKFWRLKRLIVPIVLQASILDGIAPDDSFIAVDQFQSVAALAAHLEMLSRNETEYLRYFEWTRHYQKIEAPRSEAFCRLCDRLHAPTIAHKSYANLIAWY
uniref:Fucosyltransferase n=1 Tax=Plectus sambesii TaxID=2011161 RepID=A0A914WC85_9BILA